MKRWYLSRIIGAGTEADPWRPALMDLLPNVSVVAMPEAPGRISTTWTLCLGGGADHSAAVADARVVALPQFSLDASLGTLTNAERNRVRNALSAWGITITVNWQTDSFRALLRQVAEQLRSGWDETAFDVADR